MNACNSLVIACCAQLGWSGVLHNLHVGEVHKD